MADIVRLIRKATCPRCGHRVLRHHAEKCYAALPECVCTLSDVEALAALMPMFAAEWANEKFTRLCNDPSWEGQIPSMGFQATFSQYLVEDL